MTRLIITQILIVALVAGGAPLDAVGDPGASKDNQSVGDVKKVLQRDAPLKDLIEGLTSTDFSTSIRAVDFIGDRGEEAQDAVPALVKSLDNSHLRESTLHALKNIGPHAAEAIPALFKTLTAYPDQPATRWLAAQALASIGEAAIPVLTKGAGSEKLFERIWCHAALAKVEGPESKHLLVLSESMASKDKAISLEAVNGLTMVGADAKSVIPQIIAAMDSPTTPKTDLAVLLAQMGKDAAPAIPQLTNLLDHPVAMTRQRAAYALSRIGGDRLGPAVPGLIRMLTAEEAYVREMAANTLGTAGPVAEKSIASLIDLLRDRDEHCRAEAAKALGEIAPTDPKVVSVLIKAMNDESGRVRSQVAPVLARHAPVTKELIEVFVRASEDNWKAVSIACETFFARLEPKDRELIPKDFNQRRRER